MIKRLLTMLLMVTLSLSAFAYSFTGKTYRGTEQGITLTVYFSSASRGTMTLKANGKSDKKSFQYEISGDIINVYMGGDYDYLYIDNYKEYGDDAIFLVDGYGNPTIVMHKVAGSTSSGTKKKSKRR